MKYQPPFGVPDENASYVDRDTPGAISGSRIPAPAIENHQRELVALIEAAGLTPSASDLTQVLQAVRLTGGTGYPYFRAAVEHGNVPPGAPQEGQCWIVGPAPTGAWAGKANQLATWAGGAADGGWLFTAPTPWMLVALGDRTDMRFDQAAGQWIAWEATTDVAGPVTLASDATDPQDNERAVTPSLLAPLIVTGQITAEAFTPVVRFSDIPAGNQATVAETLTFTGSRYVEVFGSAAFRNGSSSAASCQGVARLETAIGVEVGLTSYLGCVVMNGLQIPVVCTGTFRGLDPQQTYRVLLLVGKSEAVGPVEVLDTRLNITTERPS